MKYAAILLAALVVTPAFANNSDHVRKAYVALDDALNSEYQRVMKLRTPEEQQALRAEQRAWVAKRNAQCGSPDRPVTDEQVMCLGDMTVERLEQLQPPARQLPGKFSSK